MTIFLLGLGIALSQFYVFKSGIPQPAHYIIALAMLVFLLGRMRLIVSRKGELTPKILFAFVLYQGLVNFTFFAIFGKFDFIFQLVYILYGFLIFVLFFNLALIKEDFLARLSVYILLGFGVLLLFPFLGLGEYKFYPRYNAFFNDPNQMAFWVLCVASVTVFYYGRSGNVVVVSAIFVGAAFLIVLSASRSGLVGLAILAIGFLIGYFSGSRLRFGFRQFLAYILGIVLVGWGLFYALSSDSDVIAFLASRMEIVDSAEQARIRGYTRIIDYPEYLMLGAGHGMDVRFDADGIEIHSTWAGVFFYYGFFGLFLFAATLYSIFRRLSLSEKLVFMAPLFYSLSTFGLRTPIFWVYLGFYYSVILKRRSDIL